MKKTVYSFGGFGLLVLALAATVWFTREPGTEEGSDLFSGSSTPAETYEAIVKEDVGQKLKEPPLPQGRKPASIYWSRFQKAYGHHLQAKFGSDGRVIAINGNPHDGAMVVNFRSQNQDAAIRRARQILKDAESILGLTDQSPLGEPVARTTSVSSKVYFKQKSRGLPVEPYGEVVVNLGPGGELVGLQSSYIPKIKVENSFRLSAAAAKRKVAGKFKGQKVGNGKKVIWVTRAKPSAKARSAYEFMVRGKQVLIDASTGKVLFEKDRRLF